jgi:xanthine dehydrogenase YagT iron-sulfur-binding subunit
VKDDDVEEGQVAASPGEPSSEAPTGSADPQGMSRRGFLGYSLTALPGVGLAAAAVRVARPGRPAGHAAPPDGRLAVSFALNGRERHLRVDPRTSLLDALREELALPGTKKGCDHGQCGACTVLVDDRRVLSCLLLAAMVSGRRVTTVEGLAEGDQLHPMQAAFSKHDAFQCGYCTPGQIVSAVGLLREGCPADDAGIREQMSGNLCRCGAYPNIVAAIQEAREGKPA